MDTLANGAEKTNELDQKAVGMMNVNDKAANKKTAKTEQKVPVVRREPFKRNKTADRKVENAIQNLSKEQRKEIRQEYLAGAKGEKSADKYVHVGEKEAHELWHESVGPTGVGHTDKDYDVTYSYWRLKREN